MCVRILVAAIDSAAVSEDVDFFSILSFSADGGFARECVAFVFLLLLLVACLVLFVVWCVKSGGSDPDAPFGRERRGAPRCGWF